LALKIVYTRDIVELQILVALVNFVLFMPLAKCVKMVSPTVKNVNMNRMKDFKNTFKPVAYVLYLAWNNQNLALPIEDLEARVSTVTLCLYFLACSPCASLANSFITTTLHSPPLISTAGLAYIITTCHSAPLVSTRWSSTIACIITTCLLLCASFLHPLELCNGLHHNHLSVTLRH
jgi:hypothetical protein